MARYQILYWKDIPSLVEASDGAESVKLQLSERFQMLIDAAHHRSVFTILGAPEVVEGSVLALARLAVRLIDLTKHRGAHPRVGAIDVIPFVPLQRASMRDAIASAHRLGLVFAGECDVPVFFYGEAAARRDRRELPAVRTGGFEQLAERLCAPGWRPDAGPATPHPTA